MKLPLSFYCLALCLTSTSCERHKELKSEIAALDATLKQDESAARQLEKDIAALGGADGQRRMIEQTQLKQEQMRSLEFVNGPKERKLTAIETEFAILKPAAEAYKAAQSK